MARLNTKPLLLGLVVALLVLLFPSPAPAYPRPGRTERVSVAADGTQGDEGSSASSVSADGRYVAFTSADTTLVPGDANGQDDVFLVDRLTRSIRRISVASDGTPGTRHSRAPAMSSDGRFTAFLSTSPVLVPDKDNMCTTIFGPDDCQDVFVHDRETNVTERVSLASDGTQADGASGTPAISGDGRFVSFPSTASNLVPGDTNICSSGPLSGSCQDIFVHDRETGVTERVSVASDGTQANSDSLGSQGISADGRYVAFSSLASNLVAGDTNQTYDVFVHDRETGVTERVSVASDGTQAGTSSLGAPISGDGRYVAFHSSAANLVPGDSNGSDVFVHDRETGVTERVSVASDGTQGNGATTPLGIRLSADGRFVAFQSSSSNLVPGDTNGKGDIFIRDRRLGITERVSVGADGAQGEWDSQQPAMTPDGATIAFQSLSSTLVPSDTNGRFDVFVRDRGPAIGIGGMTLSEREGAVDVSGWATFSGAVLASVQDPADDGGTDAPGLGAELTKVAIAYRAEQEDVLVTLDVTRLPTMQVPLAGAVAGNPGVLYGLEFRLGGVRYEIRAVRAGVTAVPPAAPLFALYRCDPACVETARLSGGFGTTGHRVEMAFPLAAIGAAPGHALTDVRAFTARGEAATGVIDPLDEVDIPSVSFAASSVALGIAPSKSPEEEVTFQAPVALERGGFAGTVDVAGLAPGDYRVWARACLGAACGTASRATTVVGP